MLPFVIALLFSLVCCYDYRYRDFEGVIPFHQSHE